MRRLICLLSLCFGLSTLPAQSDLAVLKRALEKAEGLTKIELLNRMAAYFLPRKEHDKVLAFGAEALTLAQELKDETEAGTQEGNRKLTFILQQEVRTHNLLGQAYANGGKSQKAIRQFRTAARLAENIGFEAGLSEAEGHLETMGSGRGVQVNPGKVLKSVVETVENLVPEEEREDEGERVSVALTEELAQNAERNGNFQAALAYYEGMLPYIEEEGDTARLLTLYAKVGGLHELMGQQEKADWYLGLIDYMRNPRETPPPLSAAGSRQPSNGPKPDLTEIIEANSSTRPVTEEENQTKQALSSSLRAAERLAEEGDYEASIANLKRAQAYQAKLFALEQQWREDSIETANLIQNKVQEIETLRAQQDLRMAQRNLALIGLAAILIIAGLLTYFFFAKRSSHRQLSRAYEDLNDTHEQLKTTQTQLVSAEKMASLGQLTAGIAHEINNPVNFISGNLQPLHRDIDDLLMLVDAYRQRVQSAGLSKQFQGVQEQEADLDLDYLKEEIKDLLVGIEEGAHRTTEIVSGLRNFARLDEDEYKRYDLHQGLDSTLSLLKHHLDGIEVVRAYGDLPGVECYPGKLNQVFMNVLNNAIQAMPQGGQLRLQTRVQGDWVHIDLADTGSGMDPATLNRMFEPFFTTKEVGQGTGLGMSISHGIIRQHHGDIYADSTPGEGTIIHIQLPINQPRGTSEA